MVYKFKFSCYQRQFIQPLKTNHGIWEIREGIIVQLTDENGKVGYGEIAPLPWFGSETLDTALNFCKQLPTEIKIETVFSIPDNLPCCQFGFESAWESLNGNSFIEGEETKSNILDDSLVLKSKIQNLKSKIPYSGLLPAGKEALEKLQILLQEGYRTFKWKIGVAPITDELNIFNQLVKTLPEGANLRLDANGGLNWEEAKEWLGVSDRTGIEFLEQPLPIAQFDAMLDLSNQYSTPIALDESVATLKQMQACYNQGWRSIFVIKPCIVGYPSQLRQFCQNNQIDAVFSSVFETRVGREAALKLASELSLQNRALGFGITHWVSQVSLVGDRAKEW